MLRPRVPQVCLGAAMMALLSGCGYTHTALFPENIRSVAVPIFDNRTVQYRGLERDLTEALIKEIETRGTQMKVVRSDEAESILTGSILQVQQRVLSLDRVAGLPADVEVTVILNFEWKNQRTGEVIRDRRGFAVVGRHLPNRTFGEAYEVAQHEVAQQAARDIVTVMQSNW
ncbi:MAG: LptE family protein [Phycisphaeraceae bacterium]